MASAFAHAFAAAALGPAVVPRPRARVVVAGIVCSVLPDADVVGFALDIPYGPLLGHRGLTHAPAFAVLVAIVRVLPWGTDNGPTTWKMSPGPEHLCGTLSPPAAPWWLAAQRAVRGRGYS